MIKKTGVLERFLVYRAYRRGWADGYKRGLADADTGVALLAPEEGPTWFRGGEGPSPGRHEA